MTICKYQYDTVQTNDDRKDNLCNSMFKTEHNYHLFENNIQIQIQKQNLHVRSNINTLVYFILVGFSYGVNQGGKLQRVLTPPPTTKLK